MAVCFIALCVCLTFVLWPTPRHVNIETFFLHSFTFSLTHTAFNKREVVVISVEVVINSFDHLYALKTELDVAFDTNLYNGVLKSVIPRDVMTSRLASVYLCSILFDFVSNIFSNVAWIVLCVGNAEQVTCRGCCEKHCTPTTYFTIAKVHISPYVI